MVRTLDQSHPGKGAKALDAHLWGAFDLELKLYAPGGGATRGAERVEAQGEGQGRGTLGTDDGVTTGLGTTRRLPEASRMSDEGRPGAVRVCTSSCMIPSQRCNEKRAVVSDRRVMERPKSERGVWCETRGQGLRQKLLHDAPRLGEGDQGQFRGCLASSSLRRIRRILDDAKNLGNGTLLDGRAKEKSTRSRSEMNIRYTAP